jgi:hypothetical protein
MSAPTRFTTRPCGHYDVSISFRETADRVLRQVDRDFLTAASQNVQTYCDANPVFDWRVVWGAGYPTTSWTTEPVEFSPLETIGWLLLPTTDRAPYPHTDAMYEVWSRIDADLAVM